MIASDRMPGRLIAALKGEKPLSANEAADVLHWTGCPLSMWKTHKTTSAELFRLAAWALLAKLCGGLPGNLMDLPAKRPVVTVLEGSHRSPYELFQESRHGFELRPIGAREPDVEARLFQWNGLAVGPSGDRIAPEDLAQLVGAPRRLYEDHGPETPAPLGRRSHELAADERAPGLSEAGEEALRLQVELDRTRAELREAREESDRWRKAAVKTGEENRGLIKAISALGAAADLAKDRSAA